MNYPHLLSPLTVGPLTLPNRIVMGAMHTRLETLDHPVERLVAFYIRRASVGLILTGGHSPTPEGVVDPSGPLLDATDQVDRHRVVTDAVHAAGGRIALQILHAGRYAYVPDCVAPSALQARINRFPPRALSTAQVWETVDAFVATARLAREAGYDGVEIMGSEGYLINEFLSPATNRRVDEFGGDFDGRARFAVEIVRRIRASVGPDFLLIYRISSIDLVDGGLAPAEIVELARAVENVGADVLNTGIGWHESTVPTIAATVPRAAWLASIRRVADAVDIPVIASNRINTPEVADELLASGACDLVSMARPLLADPDFARKAAGGTAHLIGPCIACNQACLDHVFTGRAATCLVNPAAGREWDWPSAPVAAPKRIAVVGGGAAGMACAIAAARRGHDVTLFEAGELGGQLLLARRIPSKSEFDELLRWFVASLDDARVDVRLGVRVTSDDLSAYDDIVLATGVHPRVPDIPGIEHPSVVTYSQVLGGAVTVGGTVAILGAGGIGFDVAEFLTVDRGESTRIEAFQATWGANESVAGGLSAPAPAGPAHRVHLFQRTPGPLGRTLGRTTGWILKARLRAAGVEMTGGVEYTRIADDGLHYVVDGAEHVLAADTIVVCTGQVSNRDLADELRTAGRSVHLVGGCDVAAELDAASAIDQASRLGAVI